MESSKINIKITTPKEQKSTYQLREDLYDTLSKQGVLGKPITNKNDGRVAVVSRKKVGKLASTDAILESEKHNFNEAQHFEAAKHIEELYKNARLREIQPDRNGEENVLIPRYEVNFMLDGEPARAKITLKETLKGLYKGNKIYTIELESVEKLK